MIKRKLCFWLYLIELIKRKRERKRIQSREQMRNKEKLESYYRNYRRFQRVVVVEQKPMMKTTLWGTRYGNRTVIRKLAFPYVIFVIFLGEMESKYCFNRMYVYYRNQPLDSKLNILYRPNLPNVYPNYRICMAGENIKASKLPFRVAKRAIEMFWESEFNSDLPNLFRQAGKLDRRIVDLTKWKRASKKNSSFPLEIQWREACTLSEAIRRAIYDREEN